MTPTGSTRVAAVIGSPIRHSRSPAIINAAFAAAGLDWTFVAFDVAAGRGADAVAAVEALGLGGLSVTMPHKADVHAALTHRTPAAEALGAVNCVAWDGDHLIGHNTDGAGLIRSLAADGIDVADQRCTVLGAGGAARSVAFSLADAGAAEVAIVNRTIERAEVAASIAGPVGRVGSVADIGTADIVVNATSVGMGAEPDASGPSPVPPGLLHPGQVVVDLVYVPLRTPLLNAAEAVGARAIDGLGMLVHQAALAVELWTGTAPDLDVMRAAAQD